MATPSGPSTTLVGVAVTAGFSGIFHAFAPRKLTAVGTCRFVEVMPFITGAVVSPSELMYA